MHGSRGAWTTTTARCGMIRRRQQRTGDDEMTKAQAKRLAAIIGKLEAFQKEAPACMADDLRAAKDRLIRAERAALAT